MEIMHNLRSNPKGVEQCDNVIYSIIKVEKRYTDEELPKNRDRCVRWAVVAPANNTL
jgi:hypothetical protein